MLCNNKLSNKPYKEKCITNLTFMVLVVLLYKRKHYRQDYYVKLKHHNLFALKENIGVLHVNNAWMIKLEKKQLDVQQGIIGVINLIDVSRTELSKTNNILSTENRIITDVKFAIKSFK